MIIVLQGFWFFSKSKGLETGQATTYGRDIIWHAVWKMGTWVIILFKACHMFCTHDNWISQKCCKTRLLTLVKICWQKICTPFVLHPDIVYFQMNYGLLLYFYDSERAKETITNFVQNYFNRPWGYLWANQARSGINLLVLVLSSKWHQKICWLSDLKKWHINWH